VLGRGVAFGVDVVFNRNARRLGTSSEERLALTATAKRGGARVHETHTVEQLDRVARTVASRGADAVVLVGGDGSCMMGLTALARAFGDSPMPRIAFAPAGTVCTIARNLGIVAGAGAQRLLGAVCNGTARTTQQSTLRIRDDTGSQRIGFIFGAGLVSRFFEVYDASPGGLRAAAAIAARVFGGSFVGSSLARRVLDPVACRLTMDASIHPARAWSLVVASVLRDVGLHCLVTYRAGEENDRFHVVASGLPPSALGPQMPRVLAGRPLRGEPRVDALAASLRIDFQEENSGYVLDGDVMLARWVSVQTGPTLSVLVV
jgi:diacylglycerol kinase (ATP)